MSEDQITGIAYWGPLVVVAAWLSFCVWLVKRLVAKFYGGTDE